MTPSTTSSQHAPPLSRRSRTAPPVVLDKVAVGGHVVFVARDDLLAGGTKERGLGPLVGSLVAAGTRRFIYASPFCGYAQIALANVARSLGCEVTLFCEKAPGEGSLHAYSRDAAARGATTVMCESLADAEARATAHAAAHPDAFKLPLGFACPEFFRAYEAALRIEWSRAVGIIGRVPDQVFLPVGSGTLLRAFVSVLPPAVQVHAVDVNVLARDDERIAGIARMPRVTLHRAALPFAAASPVQPTFPSNPFYDAKLLPFVAALGKGCSLWWNVAR